VEKTDRLLQKKTEFLNKINAYGIAFCNDVSPDTFMEVDLQCHSSMSPK